MEEYLKKLKKEWFYECSWGLYRRVINAWNK
jgi:hypothetical protein